MKVTINSSLLRKLNELAKGRRFVFAEDQSDVYMITGEPSMAKFGDPSNREVRSFGTGGSRLLSANLLVIPVKINTVSVSPTKE